MTEPRSTAAAKDASAVPTPVESRDSLNAHLRYLSLVDELPVYGLCKDLAGKYTFVSKRQAMKLGTTPTDAIGKTDFDFYPREFAERFQEEDRLVIETEEMLVSTEEDISGNTPKFYALRKGPVHGPDGSVIGVQTIFWDITDQKNAEKALVVERDMLQTIMDQLPDFIYVKDTTGRYVIVNEGVRQILGAESVSSVIGRTNFDYLPHEQAELGRVDDQQVITMGEPLIAREECIQDTEGNDLWILTSKLPLRDRDGNISGLVGIDRNITRLKAIEAQLRLAKATADEANRAKGDFLANMSHEIRTPMNAIIGMADLLMETQVTPIQHEYLTMVQDSGESLMTLINDILDFSKIESGKFELDVISFDVRDTLGDTMKSLGLRAYKKGLELAVNVDREIPSFLKGDPGRIRQIIVNLVGNAIKFTEHGEVVLEISCQSKTDNEIDLHFSVTDTGLGIAADKCETIFDKFEQADASTTRRFGGTGLGLAISTRLVELMGGRIWVESELGKGSKFQFTTSLEIDHSRKPVVVEQPLDLQGQRVLVVDDNATNRRILKEMLTNWGMVPVTASGAKQAIQILADAIEEHDSIKLVISDVNMPQTDGIELARTITEQRLLAETSIIMLTSGARPDDINQLKSIGIECHLLKPVKQSELFTALASAHTKQASVAETPAETAFQKTPILKTRPLKILLAEDNLVNQTLVVGLLSPLGHEVTVVNNGVAAVNAVLKTVQESKVQFDLVLMDVQMPEMDGLAATREIRIHESATGAHVAIIAMTAHAMKGDREECLAAGMDDYLAKPIRLNEIKNKLRERFPRSSGESAESKSTADAESLPGPIDWKMALKRVGGNPELFYEVILAFLDDTPRLLTTAEDAAELGDSIALCASAHSLRGSLMFLNANDAFECARRLEMMAADGNIEQARVELQALKGMYIQIRSLLEVYVVQRQPN